MEFADVLIVNKTDLLSEEQLSAVERLLKKVNPGAEVLRTSHSKVEPSLLLDKARFSLRQAEAHPQWLKEAREHEHTPETVEYGISSFIYKAARPFHPERLHAALGSKPRPESLTDAQFALHAALGNQTRPESLKGLLRLKGFAWLATRNQMQVNLALAGTQFRVSPGTPWWASLVKRGGHPRVWTSQSRRFGTRRMVIGGHRLSASGRSSTTRLRVQRWIPAY